MTTWADTLRARRAGERQPDFHPTDTPREDRRTDADLDKLTKAELVDHAAARGIDVDPKARNAEIVAAIRAGS